MTYVYICDWLRTASVVKLLSCIYVWFRMEQKMELIFIIGSIPDLSGSLLFNDDWMCIYIISTWGISILCFLGLKHDTHTFYFIFYLNFLYYSSGWLPSGGWRLTEKKLSILCIYKVVSCGIRIHLNFSVILSSLNSLLFIIICS